MILCYISLANSAPLVAIENTVLLLGIMTFISLDYRAAEKIITNLDRNVHESMAPSSFVILTVPIRNQHTTKKMGKSVNQ